MVNERNHSTVGYFFVWGPGPTFEKESLARRSRAWPGPEEGRGICFVFFHPKSGVYVLYFGELGREVD